MDRFCAGDTRAFQELFTRFAPRLLRFARPMVGAAQAPDVVQVAFLKLHENRHRYRSGARVASWLFTIARNTALDHLRSAPRRREVHVEQGQADGIAATVRHDVLAADRVRAAVDALPVEQREVVLLHWFADLPFDDVARVLKLSPVAVRARAHRAYDKLRVALGDVGLPQRIDEAGGA